MPNTAIVNKPYVNIDGLKISRPSVSAIGVEAGRARNSTNVNDIVISEALVLNCLVNGANGLDAGALANNLMYNVYVIGDSNNLEAPAGIVSLASNAQPDLPFGYDMWRRIGAVRTDGSAEFLVFDQTGDGKERTMWYRTAFATDVAGAGASATFAAVDLSSSVPSTAQVLVAKCAFTPTAANDPLELRSGNSTTDSGQAISSGAVGGVVEECNLVCPIGDAVATGVYYKVTGGSVAISVQGYVDVLS